MRLIAIVMVLGACGPDEHVEPPPPPAETTELVDLALVSERKLDLLLVIDDSRGMREAQEVLGLALSTLFDGLTGVDGARLDLHVGTITSDLGTLAPIGDSACTGSSDDGRLLVSPACASMLDGSYVSDVANGSGGRDVNYSGEIAEIVECLVVMGDSGCGFEQHLEALRLSLDGRNVGFFRPDAQLAILILADEDDCSASNADFFDPPAPALGPLSSFRCFEHGVVCDEPDPRAYGARTNCRAREDSPYVDGLRQYIDMLEQLRPGRVTIAALLGDREPIEVVPRIPSGQTEPQPSLAISCSEHLQPGDRLFSATPGIRLHELVDAFGDRAAATTLCTTDYRPAMTAFADSIRDRMDGQPCLRGTFVDSPPGCEVSLIEIGEPRQNIASCEATGDAGPCWRFVDDEAGCPTTPTRLRLDAIGISPAIGTHVQAECRVYASEDTE